tara:strand:- start:44 stop:316 length:273 start_codon:yes stop_codon:yes gene_type:complete
VAITATVNSGTNIRGSISQGKTAAVTRVTVPGPKGDTGEAATTLAGLSDVDVTSLADGALIQYSATDGKFVATNELDTQTGELRITGGIF